ncbi:hypothetical protein ColKHC_04692 [Colletotrichum higginsianum]|uniref:Secreted protein n=1 Tax=Colletotrichum higginsianum TaxID=80884 RepID=A0A4T0WAZ9_9PEZI|nr:hypothetical protein CH35J_003687 [Colletotrichum higginsianum]GJC95866.1 hypothetical protein ColKHC_04692 [Colletotrichum higginsianum]
MNAWVVFILLAHVTACSGAISGSKKSGALRKAPVGDYKCVLGGAYCAAEMESCMLCWNVLSQWPTPTE